jgi:hypothetical protein
MVFEQRPLPNHEIVMPLAFLLGRGLRAWKICRAQLNLGNDLDRWGLDQVLIWSV